MAQVVFCEVVDRSLTECGPSKGGVMVVHVQNGIKAAQKIAKQKEINLQKKKRKAEEVEAEEVEAAEEQATEQQDSAGTSITQSSEGSSANQTSPRRSPRLSTDGSPGSTFSSPSTATATSTSTSGSATSLDMSEN
jgi:hypothetical protein